MKTIYIVTYAISELTIQSGVLGTFTNLYAANKYKISAELALKNSGLCGTINLTTHIISDNKDPVNFFEKEF